VRKLVLCRTTTEKMGWSPNTMEVPGQSMLWDESPCCILAVGEVVKWKQGDRVGRGWSCHHCCWRILVWGSQVSNPVRLAQSPV